jgi:hypothetical protein
VLCLIFLLVASAPEAEAEWDPAEVTGDCVFPYPEYGGFEREIHRLFLGIDDEWKEQLKAAILEEYGSKDGKEPNEDVLIDIQVLQDGLQKKFIDKCNRSKKYEKTDESEEFVGFKDAFKHLSDQIDEMLILQERFDIGLLAIIILMLALVIVSWFLLRQGGKARSFTTGAASPAMLNKFWLRRDGPLEFWREHLEILQRSEATLGRIYERLEIPRPDPNPALAPATDERVELTPARQPEVALPATHPGPQDTKGTGLVSDLQKKYSSECHSYTWEGATRRFCRSPKGEFGITDRGQIVVPRIAKVQKLNDWYFIKNGFELDNRQYGSLIIDEQPTLKQQADGSFLLIKNGRLRAVRDE